MRASFNPHPRRGAGAATARPIISRIRRRFNPHPRRGAGAAKRLGLLQTLYAVSILTRAAARVLPVEAELTDLIRRVSILTRAEARVLPSASNAMNCNV